MPLVFAMLAVMTAPPPVGAAWEPWLTRKVLPPDEARGMMHAFVERRRRPVAARAA